MRKNKQNLESHQQYRKTIDAGYVQPLTYRSIYIPKRYRKTASFSFNDFMRILTFGIVTGVIGLEFFVFYAAALQHEDAIRTACQNNGLTIWNKPHNMPVGVRPKVNNMSFLPLSCARTIDLKNAANAISTTLPHPASCQDNDCMEEAMAKVNRLKKIVNKIPALEKKCAADIQRFDKFNAEQLPKNIERWNALRAEAKKNNEVWEKTVEATFKKIIMSLSDQQKELFLSFFSNLSELRAIHDVVKLVHQPNYLGAVCSEFAKNSLLTLVKLKMKYGIDLRIHPVTLKIKMTADQMIEGWAGATESGHEFILLDSAAAVGTYSTPHAIASELDKIAKGQGYICDAWNLGLTKIANDTTGVLRADMEWGTLEIKEAYDFPFSKLKTLPAQARNFLLEEFRKMEIEPPKELEKENQIVESASQLVNVFSKLVFG